MKKYFSKIFQTYIIICKRRWEIDKKGAIKKVRQQETGRKRANNLRGGSKSGDRETRYS